MRCQLLPCLFLCLLSCADSSSENKAEKKDKAAKPEKVDIAYSFFAAGHVYGNPMDIQKGIYRPFMQSLNQIYDHPKMGFGIFTGDVVAKPTTEYWDAYEKDHRSIKLPVHLVPGNHDRGEEFEKRGYPYFQQFNRNGDLFIFLSPTNWNIEGEQLEFLKSTLDSKKNRDKNIFISMHELIWWHPDNEFGGVKINYEPHFPGKTNYWEVVHPLLTSYSNHIYLIAGDLGCTNVVSAYSYHKKDNVHFLASGMGGGTEDNVLIFDVDTKGDVHPHFKKLENFTDIIDLADYQLPTRDK